MFMFLEYMKKEDQFASQMIALERWLQIEKDTEEINSSFGNKGSANLAYLRGFKGWSFPIDKDKVSPFLSFTHFF